MYKRKSFLGMAVGAAAMGGCRGFALAKVPEYAFKWVALVHFGRKMWGDLPRLFKRSDNKAKHLTDEEYAALVQPENLTVTKMHFDEPFWRELSFKLRESGCNTVMIDVGEALAYPSHPELALPDSWSPDRFKEEVARLRGMGFEVFPKLNFSTTHDAWLGPYERMVSTPRYYEVCADLIRDVFDVFGPVGNFHIGFDEEDTPGNQWNSSLLVMRQGDLWWHDLNWFVRQVERRGARAWVWSDYIRRHPLEEFRRKMPRTVVQNPWTYNAKRADMPSAPLIKLYRTLADAGYDVVPCGSNCYGVTDNFPAMAAYCKGFLPPERFKGMIMASWFATVASYRRLHWQAADLMAEAIRETGL